MIGSGFADADEAGGRRETALRAIAQEHKLALCGPNCYGVVDLHHSSAPYSGWLPQPLRPGSVAFVLQSGALSHAIGDPAAMRGIDCSHVVTTGNEAVLDLADYIEHMATDPNAAVIACFIEVVRRPAEFAAAVRTATLAGKRIVVLKTGRSAASRHAAFAHTGAVASAETAYDALFDELGVVRVDDLDEMLEAAALLMRLPSVPRRVGLASLSGGCGGIVADLAAGTAVEFPALDESTVRALADEMPPFATVANPLDLTGVAAENHALLERCLDRLGASPALDLVAFALNSPQATDEPSRAFYSSMVQAVTRAAKRSDKPFMLFSLTSGPLDPAIGAIAAEAGIPLLQGMRETLSVLGKAAAADARSAEFRAAGELAEPDRPKLLDDIAESPGAVGEHIAKRMLAAVGIPVPAFETARTADEAVRSAVRLGYPVAVKIQSPDIAHKTEAGGVVLALDTAESVRTAFAAVVAGAENRGARVAGAFVERMAPAGTELLLGAVNRDGFGPAVVLGHGGVLADAFGAVRIALAPLSRPRAQCMVDSLPGRIVLDGYRGAEPRDVEALVEAVVAFSWLAWWLRDRVSELEVNPLRVLPRGGGVVALDVVAAAPVLLADH